MTVRRLAGAVVVAAFVLAGADTGAARTTPTAEVMPNGSVAPGAHVTVVGSGWPPRTLVHIDICGNAGSTRSEGCALAAGTETGTSSDGRLSAPIVVAVPPTPCPCALRITGTGVTDAVLVPIEITGAPVAAVQEQPVANSPAVRIDARIATASRMAATIGLPSKRRIVVTLTNDDDEPVDDIVVSARIGRSRRPTGFLRPARIVRIPAQASRTVTFDATLPAFALGTYHVSGSAVAYGETYAFATRTSTVPWLLIAVALALVQLVLLRLRNRVRQRLVVEEDESEPPPTAQGVRAVIDIEEHNVMVQPEPAKPVTFEATLVDPPTPPHPLDAVLAVIRAEVAAATSAILAEARREADRAEAAAARASAATASGILEIELRAERVARQNGEIVAAASKLATLVMQASDSAPHVATPASPPLGGAAARTRRRRPFRRRSELR